jgi:hypothetical protein
VRIYSASYRNSTEMRYNGDKVKVYIHVESAIKHTSLLCYLNSYAETILLYGCKLINLLCLICNVNFTDNYHPFMLLYWFFLFDRLDVHA